jgi:CSLREA domain-containing protein
VSHDSLRPKRSRLVVGLLICALLAGIFAQTPQARAAAFTVNSSADLADANLGDGICASSAGSCTLRAAIQEANALPGGDTIAIPSGTYTLRIAAGASDDASGDFDVTAPLTIVGAGTGLTILDGGDPPLGSPPNVLAVDRIFEIHPTAGNVSIRNLTIQGGWSAENGGGIYNASPGVLRLESVAVTGNISEVEGGGIFHDAGRLVITGTAGAPSTIANNTARGGGGVYSTGLMSATGVAARVEVAFATFSGNSSEAGGAIEVTGEGQLTVADATFSGNSTLGHGGAVAVTSKSSGSFARVSFSANSAEGEGGALYIDAEGQTSVADSSFSGNSAGGVDASGVANEAAGGALYIGGSGASDVTNASFSDNSATGEGGAVAITNFGAVTISDSLFEDNEAGLTGGGIMNAGRAVTFSRLMLRGNHAGSGGGVESQATGNFTISDSSFIGNSAETGGGFTNDGSGTLRITRSTFWDNRALLGPGEESGIGGGIFSLGDAAAEYENVTIAGNIAQRLAGGIYMDADAGIRVVNSTISANSAPVGSGVADEGTNLNLPVPSTSVIFRNTIVAGNLGGSQCNFALGSEGGNLENGDSCMFRGPHDRVNASSVGLDAVADNGGATLTQALQEGALAIDAGVLPCPATDQRGVARPQNTGCDIGAYEYTGPFPADDTTPPDTVFLEGPVQVTEATSAFFFTGSDNVTAVEDLIYECRLLESDPTEPPEIPDPTQPPEPEFLFLACPTPWEVPVIEDGAWTFEVRAIDRAGNVDPTPVSYSFFVAEDFTPPDTFFIETPPDPSGSVAVFTFGATDNATPEQFLEFECRLDSFDPLAWLECSNPAAFANLTPGQHTFQVRAADAWDNIDPSPATFTWTVGAPTTCDAANITLGAAADTYVDEGTPLDGFGFLESLIVRSAAPGNDARALLRFDIPPALGDLSGCNLSSATLRLYSQGDSGRTLEALTIDGPWAANQVSWQTQPAASGAPALASSGSGYRSWNVTSQVAAMIAGTAANHGFLIRDSAEEDEAGADQSFLASEAVRVPPTPPQLVLRFSDTGAPPPPPDAPDDPGAGTTTVFCGQSVTQSIRLANDLVGCMGEGLVIGADNIVVDLNGRTISSGAIVEPGEEDGLLAGIRNAGYDNVTIRNGTIRGFGYGVRLLPGTTYNVVEDLTLFGNVNAGVNLLDADNGRVGNIVRDNYFEGNGYGLLVDGGSENSAFSGNVFFGNGNVAFEIHDGSGHLIEGNSISGLTNNPLLDSDGGLELIGSSDNIIRDNELSDTGDAGLALREGSNNNLIEGNSLIRSSDSAISLSDSDGNQVLDNTVYLAGGAGIGLGNANDNLVRGNDVRFNPGGIELAGSSGNQIEGNNASFTGSTGIGMEGGVNNVILNNLANNNSASGIAVEAETLDALGNPIGGSLIEGNQANNNLGDGISVGGSPHTIRDNEAYNNAAFGISAAEGNLDGGGNLASGNGEPLQCVGVVCSTGSGAPPANTDLIAPDTSIATMPANGSSTADPATFTFTGSDNLAPAGALRFECRIDAPPDPPPPPPEPGEPPQPPEVENWVECASPQSYFFLLAGSHTFEVRAIDPSDNIDLTPAVYTWTVVAAPPGPDSTPPNTTITAQPDDPSTSTSASFSFTGSDNSTPGPSLAYQCALDGAAFAACTSPISYSGLGLGDHSFAVRAVDLGGNADPTPATYEWEIEAPPPDTTAPETTIDSGPEPVTVSDAASFTFSSNEAGVTFECALDGDAFASCSSPWAYGGLSVGEHSFQVRAVDAAGNTDPTPAEFSWEITPSLVPTVVSCGQVVTQSIIVLNSLTNCVEHGLVAGADKITIDLDGHVIDGAPGELNAGILVDGFDQVTVRNGTIQEFAFGVQLGASSSGNLLEGLELLANPTAGAAFAGASGSTLRSSTLAGNGDAVLLIDGASGNLVRDNDIAGSTGLGVSMITASNNRVEANTIAGGGDQGIYMLGASGNRLVGNSISGSSDQAFVLEGESNDNYVASNTVAGSEAGIIVSLSHRNQLVENRVSGSSDNGISLDGANDNTLLRNDLRFNTGGIQVGGSLRNRLEANNVSNVDGSGIELGDGALQNIVIGNLANDNAADGIAVGGSAAPGDGNLIEGNEAGGNSSDGIAVQGVGHIIKGNQANGNAGWGIYAAQPSMEGVNVDGGGNGAQGNAEPLQCYNIRCDGGPPLPLDTVAPETVLESAPANPSTRTTATFSFSGFDNATGVTFECRLSPLAAAFTTCSSPLSYSGLALGAYTFEARAIDFLGNIDATPASYSWTIQAPPPGVAPDTTILSGPDTTTSSASASFSFESDEEDVSFECRLDSGLEADWASCGSPHNYSGLSAGAHTFEVRATDGEGYADLSPASWSWTITAAPVAATMSCGQLVTASIRLSNNLTDCPGNGLVVGASNITIDLNGRTLDGINLGVGVLNNGFDNVVITNGFIQEFDFAVQLNPGTAGNVVSALRTLSNQDGGIQLSNADQAGVGNTIQGNTVDGSFYGIALLDGTSGALVRNNTVLNVPEHGIYLLSSGGNRVEANSVSFSGGAGVGLEGADGNSVIGNQLSDNSEGGVMVGGDLLPANNNLIEGNTILRGSAGISLNGSSGNQLIANSVREASGGIGLEFSNNNTLLRNDIRSNSGGISLIGSSGNRIEDNFIIGNSEGIGLEALSLGNVIVRNTVRSNAGDGIYIADPAPSGQGNRIEYNTVSNNSSGIFVNAAAHTITGNVVESNDGWGIYAVQGNIDGGGNLAAGNAEPAQCYTIVCIIGVPPGAPDTSIVLAPPAVSNSQTATFTFTGSDDITEVANLGFQCRLDSTSELSWVDCENPTIFTNLAPGLHVFEVRAVDATDYVDPTPARHEWVYQTLPLGIAPDTTIDLAPAPFTQLFEATFVFSSNEPDVAFQCSLDGAPFTPCGNDPEMVAANYFVIEYAFEEFQVGEHSFRVRAIDREGNIDPSPATYTWTIGGLLTTVTSGPAYIAPEAPGEPAEGGETEETTATFTFEASVADATFRCSLDFGPYVACDSGTISYSDLFVGEHVFMVYAIDSEGGEQLEPTEYGWTVLPPFDTVPPAVQILTTPANNSSEVVFTFSGQDNVTAPTGLVFECSLDGVTFVDCASPFNLYTAFPDFAPGSYTFSVQAIDAEDNISAPATHSWTATADLAAPAVSVLSGPPALTIALEATFTFAATDNATPAELLTFECSLDGVLFEPCASPFEASVEPGLLTFQVRAIDLAGNVSSLGSYSWEVVGPPITTFSSGPAATMTDTVATFEFAANQSPVTFECSLNGSVFQACASPLTLSDLGGGSYELAVQATNSYGIVEEIPATYVWAVDAGADATPPDTSITSGPPSPIASDTATFAFTSNELNVSFQCQLSRDGALVTPFTGCEPPYTVENLLGGVYTFEAQAVDAAGNADPTPASFIWTVLGPPTTLITLAPEDPTEARNATFEFVSNVPGSTFECWLDGVVIGPCNSGSITFTDLAFGAHNFFVYATAPGGYIDAQGYEYDWVVQEIQTFLNAGPAAVTPETGASFDFSASITGSSFECSLDGAAYSDCASPLSFAGLSVGAHTFAVRATSPGGQIDASPVTYVWEIEPLAPPDITPPTTSIVTTLPATTISDVAIFELSASELSVSFECALDGGAFGGCVSPVEYNGLAVGLHTFQARATDAAGNLGPVASFAWEILDPAADTVPPDTIIIAGPAGLNTNLDAVFEFAGSDNQTPAGQLQFQCRLDSALEADWADCGSPEMLQGLTLGEHSFEVRAIDAAGNIDPEPAMRSWTVIDQTPPDTQILTFPADVTESAEASFTFSADEAGASFECSLDGGDYGACASGVSYGGLAVGAHSFAVRAVDGLGNADLTPDSFSWIVVSAAAPVATISGGPPASLDSAIPALFAFAVDQPLITLDEFECSLDGGAFEPCENPYELELPVGSYTLAVRAVDLLGKVGPASAPYSWTVAPSATADPELNNTPAGSNVDVLLDAPDGEVLLTFSTVTVAGNTTVVETTGGPVLPSDLQLGASTFDISTTASFSGPITICMPFDPDLFSDTNLIRLYHYENGAWQDATDFVNLTAGQVCGVVSSLSPFAVVAPEEALAPTATPAGAPTNTPVPPTEEPTATNTPVPPTEEPTATNTPVPPTNTSTPTTAPVACTATQATVNASADAWIQQKSPSDNKGGDSVLKVKSQSGNDNFRTVIRFSVPATLPSGCAIESATLRIYSPSSVSGRTIEALRLAGSWAESSVTWANQPATTGAAATTTTTSGAAWREWTVTSQIQADYAAGVHHGFLIRDAVENNGGSEQQLTPRDGSSGSRPQLIIRYTSAAAPTATSTPTALPPTATSTALPPTATSTPEPTATSTPEPTATSTPEPTATSTPEPTATSTPEPTATNTPEPTATSTPEPTATNTPEPTATSTPEPTATATLNTPAGADVTTTLTTPDSSTTVTLTFANVTQAGDTTLSELLNPSPVPSTYIQVGDSTYDISTTAAFSGQITICLSYDPAVGDPGAVSLLHLVNGSWVDVTAPGGSALGLACGEVDSLSPFVIALTAEQPTALPTSTPTALPTNTPTALPTNTPTALPTSTPTALPTSTPTALPTNTPTALPTNTPTPQPPTATNTPLPTNTPTALPTSTPTALPTNTPTALPPTATNTPLPTNTPTALPTSTPTALPPTATSTPLPTNTPTPAPAACTATQVTVAANADAWIQQKSPTDNKGSDSVLKVKSQSGDDNFRTVIRFNVPATIPSGCVIESATLRIYAESTVAGRTLQALRLDGSWSENSVNWNNQPATSGLPATASSGSSKSYREWTVTSHLQADYAAGAQHYGFLIRDAVENNGGSEQQFRPRGNGNNRPQLIIRYAAPSGGQSAASGGASVSSMAESEAPTPALPSALASRRYVINLPLLQR